MTQKPSYEELENRVKELELIVFGTKEFDERLLSILSEAEKLANFGSWEWDMVRNKWTMSDNWLKIHGYTRKVITTEELLTIAYPDDINRIQEAFNQCINNGKPYEIEHRIVRHETKEVRYIRAHGRVEIDSTGKPVKLYGSAQDITEYKRQEFELKKNEEQYRSLVERTPDLVTMVDSEGRIVFVNHAAQNFYGLSPQECLGRSAFDFIHPEDRDATVASFNDWLRCPDNVLTYENCIVNIDGQRKYHMAWMILPERDESGAIIGFSSTARDITDQKRSEGALTKRNKDLQLAQRIAKVGNWTLDPDVDVPDWSDEVYRIHERDPELGPFTLADHAQILKGESLDTFTTAIQRATHEGQPYDIEVKIELASNNVKWVRVICEPEQKQGSERYYLRGTIQDITERRQAEERQELLTRRLKALWTISSLKNADLTTICDTILDEITQMTGSPYGFYGFMNETETAMNIHSWSQSVMADCSIHGKPLVFNIEKSGVWGNAVRDRKPFVLNDYQDTCANKTGLPEGHVSLTRVLAVPVFDDDKIVAIGAVANKTEEYTGQDVQQVEAFLSNVQIIIDQKRLEEDRIELEKQLQQSQKIESIGHLAGGVAHDFNNMLGVIIGHAELALMKADADNPFISDLELIRIAAKRSADLTRQLLTFARKEAISPKTINLNESVAGMLNMLQRLIGENIHLLWHPGPKLWPIKIDPAQLDQILANLCVNARDAIAGIGTITMTTQNLSIAAGDQKAADELQPGDYVRLSIADDGEGISQENLQKIFEPFFTTKEVGQGTGLGLSTVYGAIKQNHGFIDVGSELGQGATFHIYLPRQQADVESVEPTIARPLGQGEETILVVEDDQMLLNMTKAMLEESGYEVLDALTCDRAIAVAKDYPKPIHLLLSDVVMPTMNGRDLRDALLKIRPEIKVIFMSGYTDDVITQQGVLEEDTHFLQKPIIYDELTSKVQEVLDRD